MTTDREPDRGGAAGSFGERAEATGREIGRRAEELGRELGGRAERLGAEAEATGRRLSTDPAVRGFADAWTRFWGLVLLAIGLWAFARITLAMELPDVPWGSIWPLAIVGLGLTIVIEGLGRRR